MVHVVAPLNGRAFFTVCDRCLRRGLGAVVVFRLPGGGRPWVGKGCTVNLGKTLPKPEALQVTDVQPPAHQHLPAPQVILLISALKYSLISSLNYITYDVTTPQINILLISALKSLLLSALNYTG